MTEKENTTSPRHLHVEPGNPMAVMHVEGFELHFAEDVSDANTLAWEGPFGDTGWDLGVVCYRPKGSRQTFWGARVMSTFRGELEMLAVGLGDTAECTISRAIEGAAASARRSLTFLSALDARVWRDAEPENAEAIEAAVEAFASRTAKEAA